MNAKVPNKATDPPASVSLCTLKFVAPTTTITSWNNVEQNAKVPSTATNSTIAISSPCVSGSPSTSKFVALSTTVTLPTGHPTETNPVVDTTRHNTVTNPISTFSACSGQLFHSSAPTVTLISNTVENMAAVLATSVTNTNMYKHPQLSTAANTVEKSATGIPKSTLKLNLPLKIKLPTNIPPQGKKTILKGPNSVPLKKRVTFENLMATLPSNTTDDTTEKRSQSNQIMNNSLNPNTVQTPRLRSVSALLKNADSQINPSIVQSNLVHCICTSSPQVTKNNVTKPVGTSTVQHHQVTHQKDNTKPKHYKAPMSLSSAMKTNQFFLLSKHSREEIGPLVEINHIESDFMSEYDK